MSGSIARAQRILDGAWMHAVKAREAARSGSWGAFLREQNPTGLWTPRELKTCLRLAESICAGPSEARITIVPVWIGNNEGEEPDESWFSSHARVTGDEPTPEIIGIANPFEDADPVVDVVVQCRARVWTVGHVVPTQSYAPGIPLELRGKRHSVLKGEVVEVIEAEEEPSTPLPRPTLLVPPWCSWIEPRVAGLAPDLVAALRALSVTTDEEGNLVERDTFVDRAVE